MSEELDELEKELAYMTPSDRIWTINLERELLDLAQWAKQSQDRIGLLRVKLEDEEKELKKLQNESVDIQETIAAIKKHYEK